MKNLFKERDSKAVIKRYADYPKELALRVYTSRLIGSHEDLVLHGGGNTSVKLQLKDVTGEQQDVVFVKGSGCDLGSVEPEEFVGLRMKPLQKLRNLKSLSEQEMENQLKIHRIDSKSPDPSVEALLHAFLPHKYIDHTHADSILVLTNQGNGHEVVREALGPRIAVVPYTMSGLPLAKAVMKEYERYQEPEGIVVLKHGIFTFAEDAKASYERMIDYVCRGEAYIESKIRHKPFVTPRPDLMIPKDYDAAVARFAQVVRGACTHRDIDGKLRRFYTEVRKRPPMVEASLAKEAAEICRSGVLTPDHVIHTKNKIAYIESIPDRDDDLKKLVNRSVESFREDYDRYFHRQSKAKGIEREKLDPYPRLFLVAGVGLVALGFTRKAARITADIGEHTLRSKLRAYALGTYAPIAESHVFDMEYWTLQQKKLGRVAPPPLQGQAALITGAGGALGFGIADRLLAAGAVVVISDIDEARLKKVYCLLAKRYGKAQLEGICFDVTHYPSVDRAFGDISRRVGGIDIVVPNAGIAHVARIEDLESDRFDQVIAVNLTGTFNVIKASIPVFKRQGTGGNIVVISSKNVFDPGPAFGAYSASKAGAHQISKIAALELAEFGVRVNMVNPDAVFGYEGVSSKLWDLVGAERMKSRGLDPEGLKEYYRQRSLLKVSILAEHVGNAVVFFASEQTPTTGATLPIDGGIPAAFPR